MPGPPHCTFPPPLPHVNLHVANLTPEHPPYTPLVIPPSSSCQPRSVASSGPSSGTPPLGHPFLQVPPACLVNLVVRPWVVLYPDLQIAGSWSAPGTSLQPHPPTARSRRQQGFAGSQVAGSEQLRASSIWMAGDPNCGSSLNHIL